MGITPKQKETLEAIEGFRRENGYSPSFRELLKLLNLRSLNAVHQRVSALRKQGYLKRNRRKGSARDVIPRIPQFQPFPPDAMGRFRMLGTIQAGTGRVVESESEQEENFLNVPHGMVEDPQRAFLLEVEGDSMVGEHILDGDMVLVERRKSFCPGAIVVAMVDGWEATVKKAFPLSGGDQIQLVPANPRLEAKTYDAHRVEIQGVVAGILRRIP